MSKKMYPYIPNSEAAVQAEMLKFIGVDSIEELIADIPEEMRMKQAMELPEPFNDEAGLFRHVGAMLGKNKTAQELACFLGAGCYNRYVPAVVDEVINRSEFLTAYAGEPYEDHAHRAPQRGAHPPQYQSRHFEGGADLSPARCEDNLRGLRRKDRTYLP